MIAAFRTFRHYYVLRYPFRHIFIFHQPGAPDRAKTACCRPRCRRSRTASEKQPDERKNDARYRAEHDIFTTVPSSLPRFYACCRFSCCRRRLLRAARRAHA